VAVVYLQAMIPFLPIDAAHDPTARGTGWDTIASGMRTIASGDDRRDPATPRPATGRRVWFAGNRYQDASQIAFHLPDHPEVFSLNIASRPNEYDLWPSFAERARPGDDLVLVLIPPAPGSPNTVISTLRPHFTSAEQISTLRTPDLVRDVWVLRGWRGEGREQTADSRQQERREGSGGRVQGSGTASGS
jgi:hypothetical protein